MDTEGENVVAEDLDPGEGSAAAPVVWDIDEAQGIVNVPPHETVMFDNDNEVITAPNGVYLRPKNQHFQSVDAIVKPDILLQVTVAAKHPCKQKGLGNALKLLYHPLAPKLIFVVPPSRFADFKYQQYVPSPGKVTTNKCVIEQFAMEVTPIVQDPMKQPTSEGPKKRVKRS
ncbi:hypothetical protein B5M09_013151 [Aphanomyces astaci]|nr:hypothetical protein B5M09_013151 [Aphanomyces astaci]